jgi:hypothetical protein
VFLQEKMENKIELIVPPMVTVSRSAEKTINLAHYVKGHEYESFKTTAFSSRQIPESEATDEKKAEISKELFDFCRAQVEIAAQEHINQLRKEAGDAVELYGDDYKAISGYIQELYTATTKEEVDAIAERIGKDKDDFNEDQLLNLRVLVHRVRARLI